MSGTEKLLCRNLQCFIAIRILRVADLECLSRMQIFPSLISVISASRILNQDSKRSQIWLRIKEFKFLSQRNCF
jgi:hypothetical protein